MSPFVRNDTDDCPSRITSRCSGSHLTASQGCPASLKPCFQLSVQEVLILPRETPTTTQSSSSTHLRTSSPCFGGWLITGKLRRLCYRFHSLTPILASRGPPLSRQDWIRILRLSTKYEIDAGRTEAIDFFSNTLIPPAQLLHLARTCFIPEWVPVAIKQLLQRQLVVFSADDLNWLGADILLILIKHHSAISDHRARIAFKPCPVQHFDSCKDHKTCGARWPDHWFAATRALLIPAARVGTIYTPGKVAEDWLKDQTVPHMKAECFTASMAYAAEKNIFTKEVEVTADTVKALTDAIGDVTWIPSRDEKLAAGLRLLKNGDGVPGSSQMDVDEEAEWKGTPETPMS